jgi:hypothetical protein
MRQELEFGGVTARGGDLSWCVSAASLSTSFSSLRASAACILTLKTDAFLIDTLPIRITTKSLICIASARSNRHSSAALNLQQNAQDVVNSAPRRYVRIPSDAVLETKGKRDASGRSDPQHDGSEGETKRDASRHRKSGRKRRVVWATA